MSIYINASFVTIYYTFQAPLVDDDTLAFGEEDNAGKLA